MAQYNGTFLKLSPALTRKIWGGSKLELLKGIVPQANLEPIGETWEVSIHPDGMSTFNGKKLGEIFSSTQIPYLVKFIDTSDNLSVQVHPNDEYARIHENSSGKTECWLILDHEKDACIYLGVNDGVTKEQFEKSLNDTTKNVSSFLVERKVSKGDFYFVPAGTLHAIGKGITMIEIQQSSGVTYRCWDWNRVDSKGQSRELHINKSMDVSDFEYRDDQYFKVQKETFKRPGISELIEFKDFKTHLLNLKKGEKITLPFSQSERFSSIVQLSGQMEVDGISLKPYEALLIAKPTLCTILALTDTSLVWIE